MQLLIDDKNLELLLEKKKRYIGNKVAFDSIGSSFSLLVSVILASYEDVFGTNARIAKFIFVVIGLIFFVKCLYDIYVSWNNAYTHKDLLSDINALNKIQYEHSIVLIKDTFNEFSNRFLVYYEPNWKCRLFLNYKHTDNNNSFIIDHISNELNIKKENLELKYLCQMVTEKYSFHHNEKRLYCHRYYMLDIKVFNDICKNDKFTISGKDYCWMTIAEMEQDPDIKIKNLDIVEQVKGII